MNKLSGWCFLHLVEESFYKAGYFSSLIHFFNYSFILSAIIELLAIPMHASRVILAAVTNTLQNFSGLTKYWFNSGLCNSPEWMLLGGMQLYSRLWLRDAGPFHLVDPLSPGALEYYVFSSQDGVEKDR